MKPAPDPEKAKAAYEKAKPGERQFAWLRLYQARTQALKRELRQAKRRARG